MKVEDLELLEDFTSATAPIKSSKSHFRSEFYLTMPQSYYNGIALGFSMQDIDDKYVIHKHCCEKYFSDCEKYFKNNTEVDSDCTSTIDNYTSAEKSETLHIFYCLSCLLPWKW